jgi:predicted aspartyl protease
MILPLVPGGPLLDVSIGVSEPRRLAWVAARSGAIARMPVRFLIDTGASRTVVDDAVITTLQLTPTGIAPVQTASTAGTAQQIPVYDVSIVIPMRNAAKVFPAVPVLAMHLRSQGIDGLLGRDLLADALLTYSGPHPFVMLWY